MNFLINKFYLDEINRLYQNDIDKFKTNDLLDESCELYDARIVLLEVCYT